MNKSNAQELRNIVSEIIAGTIDIHRECRAEQEEGYEMQYGFPTEEEISYFIFHNPLFDEEIVEQLTDEGLLGFSGKEVVFDNEWLVEFKENLSDWVKNNSWLGADQPFRIFLNTNNPDETLIWKPSINNIIPNWAESSPTYILLAIDLIRNGKLLSELNWRDFEKLIADLLENEGWQVCVKQKTRDGGIDVIAERVDLVLGKIKSVWQAKKYGLSNKVKLSEVRELSAIRDAEMATKGIVVTTNHLTSDAI